MYHHNLGRSLMCIIVPSMISFRSMSPLYAWWYSLIKLRIMGWTWNKSCICLMWNRSSVGGYRSLIDWSGGRCIDLLSFLIPLLVAAAVWLLPSLFVLWVLPSIFLYRPLLPCATILLLISSKACFASMFLPWPPSWTFPSACGSSFSIYHSLVFHWYQSVR